MDIHNFNNANSDEEIENDISELEQDKADIKTRINEFEKKYDNKINEAKDAPEHLVDDLLLQADDIECSKNNLEDEWQQLDDKVRLLKTIQSFRRRIRESDQWNLDDLNSLNSAEDLQSELRDVLENHIRTEEQVERLFQLFTDTVYRE